MLALVVIGKVRIKMENIQKNWKPKRWLATLLSLFLGCSGMLYLGKGKLYLVYTLATLFAAIATYLSFNLSLIDLLNLFSLAAFVINIVCAIHTYKLCTNFKEGNLRPWYSHWWGIVGIYLMIVIPIIFFRSFFYEPFYIPSMSMSPNYVKGDHIVVSKLGYGNYGSFGFNILHIAPTKKIQRGDVIVFAHPPNPKIDFIMRVIGLPNDKVTYTKKTLSINGKPLPVLVLPAEYDNEDLVKEIIGDTSWLIINTPSISPKDFEITVPSNSYFVMGDNRDNSYDSRYWGSVPAKNIKGKVIYSTGDK